MKFIMLTRKYDGKKVYVNPTKICFMGSMGVEGDSTIIQFSGTDENYILVSENPEAIEKLKAYEAEQGHSDTIDESYTIGYKQANNNSKSNTECDGCLYDDGIKEHSLCHTCSNAYINHWTAKPQEDEEIKVGDEVVEIQSSARFCVTHFWVNNHGEKGVSGFNHECSAFQDTFDKVKKTGRHFDIEKILEGMKA